MIAVIDYDTGNVGSILNMLRKVGAKAEITRDRDTLESADKLILPGVGAFDEAMNNLERFDLRALLHELVVERRKPILGICLGAQVMCESSEEGGRAGLGWLRARVVKFDPTASESIRVPHIGWNTVESCSAGGEIFLGVAKPMRFYFVHSFHFACDAPDQVIAETSYGYRFPSALAHLNILSMQFHPEKSHKYGLQLFQNFVERFETC